MVSVEKGEPKKTTSTKKADDHTEVDRLFDKYRGLDPVIDAYDLKTVLEKLLASNLTTTEFR